MIEALGDHRLAYATDKLIEIAKREGPLQDDAILALGKIGDKRALEAFAALQRSGPPSLQPTVAAAICTVNVCWSSS